MSQEDCGVCLVPQINHFIMLRYTYILKNKAHTIIYYIEFPSLTINNIKMQTPHKVPTEGEADTWQAGSIGEGKMRHFFFVETEVKTLHHLIS